MSAKLPDKIDLESEGGGPCGQGDYVDLTNYSECISWKDNAALLTLGGTILGGEFEWLDFMVPGSEVKGRVSGMVMDVEVDETVYQRYIKNFTTLGLLFSRAGGQGRITRSAWKKSMGGTDPLRGMIIKELNAQITGGGIHTHSHKLPRTNGQ